MKKIVLIMLILAGFSLTASAQKCSICVTIDDQECDYQGVITNADFLITIYQNENGSGASCYFEILHVPYPVVQEVLMFKLPEGCEESLCEGYQTAGIIAVLKNDYGTPICSGYLAPGTVDPTCYLVIVGN